MRHPFSRQTKMIIDTTSPVIFDTFSDYDDMARRHSVFQVFYGRTRMILDPFECWEREWHSGVNTSMINVCQRSGDKCTDEQLFVFENLQMYSSSRPLGSPRFVCHFRRNTGSEKDTRKLKAGECIDEWSRQIVAASPPSVKTCIREDLKMETNPMNAMTGRCYSIDVPENSTYVIPDLSFEMIFPVGCKFIVLEDEKGDDTPVKLRLDQTLVKHGDFPGPIDDVTDKEWFRGVLNVFALASWKATKSSYVNDKVVYGPLPYLMTPLGYVWEFFKRIDKDEEHENTPYFFNTYEWKINEIEGEELKNIRDDFFNSTIYVPPQMVDFGERLGDHLNGEIRQILLRIGSKERRLTQELSWRATKGMFPTYGLMFKRLEQTPLN